MLLVLLFGSGNARGVLVAVHENQTTLCTNETTMRRPITKKHDCTFEVV